jgi:hypothetical protein
MTETGSLAKALAAFQAEMPTVAKSKKATVKSDKGSYSYTYAGLAEVSHAALPLLTKHGLSFSCTPEIHERGPVLTGILLHVSGESLRGSLPIATGGTPQQTGSSITYMRRYLFGCLTGLVTEDDDDGALASKRATRSKGPTPEDDPWYDTPAAPSGSRQISKPQLGKMGALMSELGITARDSALLYVKDVIGRDVTSRNDLTTAEAGRVIDALERDRAQPFPTPPEVTP